jgi:hypothetical protein
MVRLMCLVGILALLLGAVLGCSATEKTPEENIPSGETKLVVPEGGKAPSGGNTTPEEFEKRVKGG